MRAVFAHIDIPVRKNPFNDDVEERSDAAAGCETFERGEEGLVNEAEFGMPGCESGRISRYDELKEASRGELSQNLQED